MFKTFIFMTVLVGLIIADPLSQQSSYRKEAPPSLEDLELSFSPADEDLAPRALRRSPRFITLAGLNFIGTLIQHKISAISIIVTAIKYIATSVPALIFGGFISFAFCKITGKCQLNYNQVVPYEQAIGPEYAMAEDMIERAVQRYKRENGEF